MIELTKQNVCKDINRLLLLLEDFEKLDLRGRISGDDSKIVVGINKLADIINQILSENKSNGLTLEESSKILLSNVNTLNQSSGEFSIFDDDDKELASTTIEEWMTYEGDDF